MFRRTDIDNLRNVSGLYRLFSTLCIIMASVMPLAAVAQDEIIVDWDIEYETMAPTLESALVVENLSNGRYRASVDVSLGAQWDLHLRYFIASPTPAPVTVEARIPHTGALRASGNLFDRLLLDRLDAEEDFQVFLDITTADPAIDYERNRLFTTPAVDPTLLYFFDVGNDGAFEVAGGGQSFVEFQAVPGVNIVDLAGFVRGVNGPATSFGGPLGLPNAPPQLDHAHLMERNLDDQSVVLAFSGSDPDGDDLSYRIEWGDGDESDTAGNLAAHTYPAGAGVYQARVTVSDWRGASAEVVIEVRFDAEPVNQAPVFEIVDLVNKDSFEALVTAIATDADGDGITYVYDWGDGTPAEVVQGHLNRHTYPDAIFGDYVLTVLAQDGRGGQASQQLEISFPVPQVNRPPTLEGLHLVEQDGFDVLLAVQGADADGDALSFDIEWGDGSSETSNGPFLRHTYPPGEFDSYRALVTVRDGRGGQDQASIDIEFVEPAANQAPSIEQISLIERDGLSVTVQVSAADADGDSLTYTFDWGDGTGPTVVDAGVAQHVYADFGDYNVTVTVNDGSGGNDQSVYALELPAPAENRAPVLDMAEVIAIDGFTVTVAASATDADSDPISFEIDWGDGARTTTAGGVAQHEYAADFVAYDITVTAEDPHGANDSAQFPVEFERPPANEEPVIDSVQILRQDGFNVTLAIAAHDADRDVLSYRVDWGDGTDNDGLSGIVNHSFAANVFRIYTVTIIVEDGRGGFDTARIELDFPAPPVNEVPTFDQAEIVDREGFFIVVATHAVDPEGDPLTYTFNWGDGSPNTVQGGGLAAHRYPEGDFRAYVITVAVSDGQGERVDTVRLDLAFEAPADNQPPAIRLTEVIARDGFSVSLAVDAVDPDGDALVYTFDWGDGSDADVTGGGIAAHTFAQGVFRNYTATVSVSDGRGGRATADIEIDFPAPPDNESPVFELAELVRMDGFDVVLAVNAIDPDGDPVTYRFDWGDASPETISVGGVAEHSYPADVFRAYTVTIIAEDDRGGSTSARVELDFPAPLPNRAPVFDLLREIDRDGFRVTVAVSAPDPDGDQVSYSFDWGDESEVSETTSGVLTHTFPADRYEAYMVVVTARDAAGAETIAPLIIEFVEPPPNVSPIIESVRLIRQGDWDVTATIGAVDADEDPLTFTIDWGDGSENTVNGDGIAGHTYPEGAYRPYTVTVRVSDGRGGEAEGTEEINFPNPPPNQSPTVENIDISLGARGQAELVVSAFDPEGEALSYLVHWGDEEDPDDIEALPAGRGSHAYAIQADNVAYQGFVIVIDASGGRTESPFIARVVDQPTVIREVVAEHIEDGTVRINVIADDDDGQEFLAYSFDFEDDEVFDVVDVARSSAVHRYGTPGEHRFTVRVTDTWSGQSVTDTGRIELAPWLTPNRAPIILDMNLVRGPRGHVEVVTQAFDEDGDALTYSVHWGDELINDAEVPAINGQAQHAYTFDPELNAYEGYVKVTDPSGADATQAFEVVVIDAPTNLRSLDAVDIGGGVYELTIIAEDPDAEGDLAYSFDFDGDGEWDLEDVAFQQARHAYASPGDYQVRVRVRDAWSGAISVYVLELAVAPWVPENRAPEIDGFALDIGPRGRVTVQAEVRDPEGGALRSFVQWGDEDDAGLDTEYIGDSVSHDYAFRPAGQAYQGRLRVVDQHGSETLHPFVVALVDAPTQIRRFETERIREGTWLLRVDAIDDDAEDDLRYAFDFDADGTWDIIDQPGPQVVHTFPDAGEHRVRIGVRDPWSQALTEAIYLVGPDRQGTPNRPPVIDDLELQVGPGGHAQLKVDSTDPEGGAVTLEVAWGDTDPLEFEPLLAGEGAHAYAYPLDGRAYDGRVRLTDPAGLTTEASFTAEVVDRPTLIEEISISVLRNGKVLVTVAAQDPDTEHFTYAFDMNGDGLSESGSQVIPEYVYEYRRGGTYEVVVSVTDPWSGQTTELEREFILEPWISAAPVADDHLEGEEGRCLVLRLNQGRVTSESGQSICDREENPNAEFWRWDFGDGTVARGSEVGHIYPNDGIFSVTVSGGEASQPIESVIEVLVVNVAPTFVTQPPEFAQGGETYFYTIELNDQGPEDEIKLELVEGIEGMFLEPLGNRQWQLTWDVPQEMDAMIEVEIKATDGQTVDGVWQPDGGETVQRYRLTVLPTPIPDAAPPEPDAFRPSFENITGDQIGCAATDFKGQPWAVLSLLLLLGLSLRRRR